MGLKVSVFLFNRFVPFHCCGQHVALLVEDTETERFFSVDYGKNLRDLRKYKDETSKINQCCLGVQRLYSTMSYGDFAQKMRSNERFQNNFTSDETYNLLRNNCADAVESVLREIYPEYSKIRTNKCYKSYQMTSSIMCLLTGLSIFPAPPCLATPRDVYNKAVLMGCSSYGIDPAENCEVTAPKTPLKIKIDDTSSSSLGSPVAEIKENRPLLAISEKKSPEPRRRKSIGI